MKIGLASRNKNAISAKHISVYWHVSRVADRSHSCGESDVRKMFKIKNLSEGIKLELALYCLYLSDTKEAITIKHLGLVEKRSSDGGR